MTDVTAVRIGELLSLLGEHNYMLVHTTRNSGKYEVFYAPTPTTKVMPIAVGDVLLTVLEKAVEVAGIVKRNEGGTGV